jgi:hypothetical protein
VLLMDAVAELAELAASMTSGGLLSTLLGGRK